MTDQPKIGWQPGGFVTEPGIYPSIPLDDYHGKITKEHSVSHSGLERLWSQSPAHYWDRSPYNPDADVDEPTEPMILGRAAHHLFMGERGFKDHFVARPLRLAGYEWNSRRNEHKAWLEEQAKKGLTVLLPSQIESIMGMRRALAAEPLVQQGLLSGRIEQSLVWRDPVTGVWIKSRPDAIPTEGGDFVDLKCVSSVTPNDLSRMIGDRGYHRQGATICEGAHHCLGLPLKFGGPGEEGLSFTLVFVETKRPHCVEIVTLKPGDLQRGVQENHAALRLLKRCLDSNDWPGPSGHQADARYIGIPEWQQRQDEYRLQSINAQLSIKL
jgi:hypothetical protein